MIRQPFPTLLLPLSISMMTLLGTTPPVLGVVTSDTPGSHTTTNGVNAFSVDHHGVGRIGPCTGSLLSDGRSVLTAAHCIGTSSVTATFVNPSGTSFSQTAFDSGVATHPSWDNDVLHGHDIAVVTFPVPFDSSIPRYEIVSSGFNAIGKQGVFIGYGQSGIGSTGATLASGTKRAGLIQYESFGLGVKGETGWLNDNTQLTADFDSGNAANDAFNILYGDSSDLGFGVDEVGPATTDNGGPTFYDEGGRFRIGAVWSWVFNDIASDVLVGTPFTWGEFNGSANLGNAAMNFFVASSIGENIIIEKVTDPAGSAARFDFTNVDIPVGPASFSLSDVGAPQVFANVPVGSYEVREEDPDLSPGDFVLDAIFCDDGASPVPSDGDVFSGTATINVDDGETVTCTFTNLSTLICNAPDGENLSLANGTLDRPQVYEVCDTIVVGPGYVVDSLGDLTLRAGRAVVISPDVRVEAGGRLTIETDPTLLRP